MEEIFETTSFIQSSPKRKSIEQLLLDIFGGNPYHAKSREVNGDLSYAPIEVSLTEDSVRSHLEGKETLGSYQLIQGSNVVRWLGWDVDCTDTEVARSMVNKIIRYLDDVPYAIEFSGRKGYHILVFLKEPINASEAKHVVDYVREKENLKSTGDAHVECFPKQDKLTKSRSKGSLLKIPLGLHPKSRKRSMFVDILNGWENGPELNPYEVLSFRADPQKLREIIISGPGPEEQLVELLTPYWVDGKRHELSLYLCGYLAHEGWGSEQVKTLIREITAKSKDDDEYNRIQTVETTFIRFKEGKSIRGRQGLGEMLPVSAMQQLTELVSLIRAPDTVAQVDDIRYSKGRPVLENARLASNTIWSILNDNGCRIFQTNARYAFWYDAETHLITEEGSEIWRTLLNKLFGLNPCDAFSKLVYAEVRLRIVREAPMVPIQNRTFWSEDLCKLFVNLGGPEVYIVSGTGSIEKSYNGECGYMFITNESGKYVIPDFEVDTVDTWEYLVDDLSFSPSNEAPAQPEEQKELLKAWILAFFFQELMPTKPILSILGVSGSGKTTAIRRILKILEEPDSDVLGIPTDKQDAFRASIEGHRLLVLDNLEKSGAFWMVDMLNKLATGNNIELRELYRTNAKHTITPKCFVACTAVNMPFSDETLFSRLLILEMEKILEPLPEHILQRRIKEFGPAIWADLLRKLSNVVEAINTNTVSRPSTRSRLVDFTVFCDRIANCGVVNGKVLSLGLLSMIDSQLRQLKESSQAITMIEEWMSLKPEDANKWRTYTEIFEILQNMCNMRKIDFKWKNPQALYRHLTALEDRLKRDFAAEFKSEMNSQIHKEIPKIRFRNTMSSEEKPSGNGSGAEHEISLER